MFSITLGDYRIDCVDAGLPDLLPHALAAATLAEAFDMQSADGTFAYVAVARDTGCPFLVVTQRYEPSGYGFFPGALLVPDTDTLFIGAGSRLLAYDLRKTARLWEDVADVGFHCWARSGDVVLMSAELELAAWDTCGNKLWSTFVEPPWSYEIDDGEVVLDVMGDKSVFDLAAGPDRGGRS